MDFGAYLEADFGKEILLPKRYISEPLTPGDEVDVVVYTDSEDRPVASTETPYAYVDEFAFLNVVAVTKVGAFLDWGLPKDLLVPFSPEYVKGQKAGVLVFDKNDVGYRCIVDNRHFGILYNDEVFSPVNIGDRLDAYVKQVRPDGKIDLMLGGRADVRTNTLADKIFKAIKSNGGKLEISDKSSPEEIKQAFMCSKKDFKKAVGHLLKDGKISVSEDKRILFARK